MLRKSKRSSNPSSSTGVKEALQDIGVQGLSVLEVKGSGAQKGHTELYRGAEYVVDFLPKVEVEVVFADDQVETADRRVSATAKDRQDRRGKIFVSYGRTGGGGSAPGEGPGRRASER